MKLNENIPVKELILLNKLIDDTEYKCYCGDINPDYPTIDKACDVCARLNWYIQDLNKVCKKLLGDKQ